MLEGWICWLTEEFASRVDEMALPSNINHDKSLVLKSMTFDSNAFPVLHKLPHIHLDNIHITDLLAIPRQAAQHHIVH